MSKYIGLVMVTAIIIAVACVVALIPQHMRGCIRGAALLLTLVALLVASRCSKD